MQRDLISLLTSKEVSHPYDERLRSNWKDRERPKDIEGIVEKVVLLSAEEGKK